MVNINHHLLLMSRLERRAFSRRTGAKLPNMKQLVMKFSDGCGVPTLREMETRRNQIESDGYFNWSSPFDIRVMSVTCHEIHDLIKVVHGAGLSLRAPNIIIDPVTLDAISLGWSDQVIAAENPRRFVYRNMDEVNLEYNWVRLVADPADGCKVLDR